MGVPIKPGDDYVLAEQGKAVTRTASGFIIPESAADKPGWTIVAVGASVKRYKVGEKIFFKTYSQDTVDVSVGKDEYKLINQHDIAGVQTA